MIEAFSLVRINPCDPHHKIGEVLFTDSPFFYYFFIPFFYLLFFSFVLFVLFWFLLACFVGSPLHATLRIKLKGEIEKNLYC